MVSCHGLRDLDLSACHVRRQDYGEEYAVFGQCRRLEMLSIAQCELLESDAMLILGQCSNLIKLDVRCVVCVLGMLTAKQ